MAWSASSSAPDVVRRAPTELGRQHRDRGAQDVERGAAAGQRRQQRAEPRRQGAPPAHLVAERRRGGCVGQLAPEEEMPHVLERPLLGQVDGRVLAVVEEALLPADVADRGLGHHDALEPGRYVAARLGGGTDARHAHEVAQRHHADALVAVDDGEVAVVVRGQARPGRIDPLVGAEHVGPGRHPQGHLLAPGIAGPDGGPQQVPLGEDAHDLAVVGHDDRTGVGVLHHAGRLGQGDVGRAGHGRRRHEVSHDGFHATHYAALEPAL